MNQTVDEVKEILKPALTEEKVIWEFGVTEANGGQVYRVEMERSSFMMKVCDGPLQRAEPGGLVGLSDITSAPLFFCGKISPVDMPPLAQYECLRDITIVIDGLFKRLKPKDRIELTKSEALSLLRRQEVKFIKEVMESDDN
jgi:hypothetical protein